jgi:hypothetical protein
MKVMMASHVFPRGLVGGRLINKYGTYPRFGARIGAVNYQNILATFKNRRSEYYQCRADGITDGGLRNAGGQRLCSDF